jgi:hypothetical protein
LSIDNEVLKDIVNIARYSDDVIGKRFLWDVDSPRLASSWWRDLYQLDGDSSWFSLAVSKKVGRDDLTYLTN